MQIFVHVHLKMKLVTVVVFLCIVCVSCLKNNEIGCRDENNNLVDWFYIYKLPKNKFSKNTFIKEGTGYLFITPKTIQNGWTVSTNSINSSLSIPGLTLAPLYEDNDDNIVVIYNDQPLTAKDLKNIETTTKKLVKSKSFRKRSIQRQFSFPEEKKKEKLKNAKNGHTKGVVLGDDKNGLWLIHSVPKFPPIPDQNNVNKVSYSYPPTAMRYGQSFLCISLKATTLNDVGQQLSFNEPKILFSHVPCLLKAKYAKIVDVINGLTVAQPPWSNVANITSRDGVQFVSFAKATNFKEDLYDGLVAQQLKSDLFVESWINGAGVLESNCTFKYKVNNVEKVAFHDKGIAFSSHADHSKWAVAAPEDKGSKLQDYWICVGDINRAQTQESRGGGTVCTRNQDMWKLYVESINEVQSCQRPNKFTLNSNNYIKY